MAGKTKEKKMERISKEQKHKLVDYKFSHLEFVRGQFGGINGNIYSKEEWESLRVTLNSMGGSAKSVEQWKKCWIDLKSSVKKQINTRRSAMNKTGGGGWTEIPRDLNPLEEKILQIITVDAVDGDSCTPESGIIEKSEMIIEESNMIIEESEMISQELSDESLCSIEFLEYEDVLPSHLNKPSKSTTTLHNYTEATSTTFKGTDGCKTLKQTQKATPTSKYTKALVKQKQIPPKTSPAALFKYTETLGKESTAPLNTSTPKTISFTKIQNKIAKKASTTNSFKCTGDSEKSNKTSSTTTASKYSEALVEAREMQTVLMKEFEKLRNQNDLMFKKICSIEQKLNEKADYS